MNLGVPNDINGLWNRSLRFTPIRVILGGVSGEHKQRWIKVNASVDAGLAEVISILSRVDGLTTLQSCQGDTGERNGYIYFSFGEWPDLCRFVFERVGPVLLARLGEDVQLEVMVAELAPVAKMTFSAEAVPKVASALKEVFGC